MTRVERSQMVMEAHGIATDDAPIVRAMLAFANDELDCAAKAADEWAASDFDESSTTMALSIAHDIRALKGAE